MESGDKTQTDLLFEGVGSRVEFDLLNGDKRSSKATRERRLVSPVRESLSSYQAVNFLLVRVRTQLTTTHVAHVHPSLQSTPAYRNHLA